MDVSAQIKTRYFIYIRISIRYLIPLALGYNRWLNRCLLLGVYHHQP